MLKVRFACGHEAELGVNADSAICHCGNREVVRTFARAPRFTGVCTGPYAAYKALDPVVVNVAPGGPLVLKEQK